MSSRFSSVLAVPLAFAAVTACSTRVVESWSTMSTANAPVGRSNHTAVWTGTEMMVWGGYDGATQVSSGGGYKP